MTAHTPPQADCFRGNQHTRKQAHYGSSLQTANMVKRLNRLMNDVRDAAVANNVILTAQAQGLPGVSKQAALAMIGSLACKWHLGFEDCVAFLHTALVHSDDDEEEFIGSSDSSDSGGGSDGEDMEADEPVVVPMAINTRRRNSADNAASSRRPGPIGAADEPPVPNPIALASGPSCPSKRGAAASPDAQRQLRRSKPSSQAKDRRTFKKRQQQFQAACGGDMTEFVAHCVVVYSWDPAAALALITQEVLSNKLSEALGHRDHASARNTIAGWLDCSKRSPDAALALMMQLRLSHADYHVLHMTHPTIYPPLQHVLNAMEELRASTKTLYLSAEDARAASVSCVPVDVLGLGVHLQPDTEQAPSADAGGADAGAPAAVTAHGGKIRIGFCVANVAQVVQAEAEAFLERHPKPHEVSCLHFKRGTDNFQHMSLDGTLTRHLEQMSVALIEPGQLNNSAEGMNSSARLVAVADGKETEALVRTMWDAVSEQLPDEVVVGGRRFPVHYPLSADYKLATLALGHMGPASTYFCTFCYDTKADVLTDQDTPLRDAATWLRVSTFTERHSEHGTLKQGTRSEEHQLREEMQRTCCKCSQHAQPSVSLLGHTVCCQAPFCLTPHAPITQASFNTYRKSVVRSPMSKVDVECYAPEALHMKINITNRFFKACCSVAHEMGLDLPQYMSNTLQLPWPITQ